jgi:hypothetical protein
LALADTMVPSIAPEGKADVRTQRAVSDSEYAAAVQSLKDQALDGRQEIKAEQYLAERPSENPAYRDAMWRLLSLAVPEDGKKKLAGLFDMLE